MVYRLEVGDICWRSDLAAKWGYRQYTLAGHCSDVERIAEGLRLPTVPYAVIAGCGEIWACYEDDFNHPQALYEFIEHQQAIQ